MGYDVHITRCENWWDEQGPDNSTPEWEAVVAADPGLVMFSADGGWRGEPEWIAELVTTPEEAGLGGALCRLRSQGLGEHRQSRVPATGRGRRRDAFRSGRPVAIHR